jgi:hypothetical protein
MHAVCADVGLFKNNKIKLLSQNGLHRYYRDGFIVSNCNNSEV